MGQNNRRISADEGRRFLGAILLDGSLFNKAYEVLGGEPDFEIHAHDLIWEAMWSVEAMGDPINIVSLAEALAEMRWLKDVGGVTYLATLPDGISAKEAVAIVQ